MSIPFLCPICAGEKPPFTFSVLYDDESYCGICIVVLANIGLAKDNDRADLEKKYLKVLSDRRSKPEVK